jgi:hypothetical protein
MALSAADWETELVAEFKAAGFKVDDENCFIKPMAKVLAKVSVSQITANAEAKVIGGSSTGSHKIA